MPSSSLAQRVHLLVAGGAVGHAVQLVLQAPRLRSHR